MCIPCLLVDARGLEFVDALVIETCAEVVDPLCVSVVMWLETRLDS